MSAHIGLPGLAFTKRPPPLGFYPRRKRRGEMNPATRSGNRLREGEAVPRRTSTKPIIPAKAGIQS
jgi:hypothetical protein